MRPDFSVLFLTTLIGAGQGLFLALVAMQVLALFDLAPAQDGRGFHAMGAALALALLVLGLVASFFHLGRPERGWRAIAQWRTSWLSREVIVLPTFMGAVFLYAVAHWVGATNPSTLLVGAAGVLLALALFVCTAMIYACLPFLREWHTPLTVANFILMGCASGCAIAAAFAAAAAPALVRLLTACALLLTLLAFLVRVWTLARNARLRPRSTLQTAIGIKHPRIRQTAMGFGGGSFNTREFFHGRTREAVQAVKWSFVAGAFAVPAALLAASLAGAPAALLWLAAAVQFPGLLAERWFFFAEANHPQNLYYQAAG